MECMALFRTLHYSVAVLSAVLCLAQCILVSSILIGEKTHSPLTYLALCPKGADCGLTST